MIGDRLNIACGTDYREGFINIDGSDELARVDKVVRLGVDSLLDHFTAGSIEYILANDIIEHHFHWEAVLILKEFFQLLAPGGRVEIRVPATGHIISNPGIPLARKITLLYGGQDIPQGTDAEMDESRRKYPQYFCHKYGWTIQSMTKALVDTGFSDVTCQMAGTNFIAYAVNNR